jgi:hypothetical protein
MKRAIILPALVTAFVALSPAGIALATPSPESTLPVINVDNPGSGLFCNANSCWIERGTCSDSRPYSEAQMTKQCV